MRILFTGGGTLGSVTPLLAVHEQVRDFCARQNEPYVSFWIGTRKGPERTLVDAAGIRFYPCISAKIRRYMDVRNILAPFLFLAACIQSFAYVLFWNPTVIINAGSYVGLAAVYAGWMLRKRVILLQIDWYPSLSNVLGAPFSSIVCVATDEQKKFFPHTRTRVVGIPVRKIEVHSERCKRMRSELNIPVSAPLVTILGGGTGAHDLNELVRDALPALKGFCHIIHITGSGKYETSGKMARMYEYYHPCEFTKDAFLFSACSDCVVTRAGVGTLAELSVLGKPACIIPLPDSHQEKNADAFARGNAALVLSHKTVTVDLFVQTIRKLITDMNLQKMLSKNIRAFLPDNASRTVADIVLDMSSQNL